jgi:hypothetical protein
VTTNPAAGPVGLLERAVREDLPSHKRWTEPRGPLSRTTSFRASKSAALSFTNTKRKRWTLQPLSLWSCSLL